MTVATTLSTGYTVRVVFTTVPWRTGARRRAAERGPQPSMAPPERLELAEPTVPPRRSKGAAAATNDRFMDLVVLISVLLFLLLAIGVGLLVLRSTALLH